MKLIEFQVENYRSFASRQTVVLRPLTLFFGRNSGGKSALLRFLPLLSESIRADTVMELGGQVARGATWRDIVCRQNRHPKLGFTLSWQAGSQAATETWIINGEFDGRSIGVDRVNLSTQGGPLLELIAADATDDPQDALASLTLSHEQFTPFLPDELRVRRAAQLRDGIDWLTGIRTSPPRIYPYAGAQPTRLRPDGSNAIDYVLYGQERPSVIPLAQEFGAFFEPLGLRLRAEMVAESIFRLTLNALKSPEASVNLLDTGEGYAQVLPVLVALARTRQKRRILCLEQPELHLHTHAQTVLASRLIGAAIASPDLDEQSSILVETHSEVVLASVQLAIARGELSPERVRVYWVEANAQGISQIYPVDFDVLGRPTSPVMVDAFAQAIQLGDELMKVRRGKRG